MEGEWSETMGETKKEMEGLCGGFSKKACISFYE